MITAEHAKELLKLGEKLNLNFRNLLSDLSTNERIIAETLFEYGMFDDISDTIVYSALINRKNEIEYGKAHFDLYVTEYEIAPLNEIVTLTINILKKAGFQVKDFTMELLIRW